MQTAPVVYSVHANARSDGYDRKKKMLRFQRDGLRSLGLVVNTPIWVRVVERYVLEISPHAKAGFSRRLLSSSNYGDVKIHIDTFSDAFEPDGGVDLGSYSVRLTKIAGGFRVYLRLPLERVRSRIE